jgi:hypothetical protein
MTFYAHTAASPDGTPDPAERRWLRPADRLRTVAPREQPHRLDSPLRSRWGEGGPRPDDVGPGAMSKSNDPALSDLIS